MAKRFVNTPAIYGSHIWGRNCFFNRALTFACKPAWKELFRRISILLWNPEIAIMFENIEQLTFAR